MIDLFNLPNDLPDTGVVKELEPLKKVTWNTGLKGKCHSEETRRKIGEASASRKHTEETKRKISKVHKGRILSEEHKRKLNKANKKRTGIPRDEETRRKISANTTGKKKCVTPLGLHNSIADARRAHNFKCGGSVTRKIKSDKYADWYYIK